MSKEERRSKRLTKLKEHIKKEMGDLLALNLRDWGLSDSDQNIFKAIWVLNKHSQRLNCLTWTLIGLTAILIVATIADIIVRVT